MAGSGRTNMNPATSTILEDRRLYREYYSSIHRVRVTDLHLDNGTVSVQMLSGGDPRTIDIPLIGFSVPPKSTEVDKNYRRYSWGMYVPQVGDILLIGFDPRGTAYSLGYHFIDFKEMKRMDDATEPSGGIGWGDASGKRLRPGDWSFKSGRGSALYLGDRVSATSGSNSLTLDSPQNEARLQSDLIKNKYGGCSESRMGSVKRIAVPGVDTQESYIQDSMFGSVAQEHTHYVRRGSITAPTPDGFLMVRTSEGEIVDDATGQITPPSKFASDLSTALVGTGARVLRQVMDDASGAVVQWAEVVDNLGNYGISAKTATGFQWNSPLAAWTVSNLSASYTTSTTYDLSAGVSWTVDAPMMSLGSGASEQLILGTTFMTQLAVFLGQSAGYFTALASSSVGPLAALATNFTNLATAFTTFSTTLNSMLSTRTKTV